VRGRRSLTLLSDDNSGDQTARVIALAIDSKLLAR
jgi:hypothetical protein